MAYVLAFCMKYTRQNPDFLKAMKGIMQNFQAVSIVRIIEMFEDLVTSRKLNTIINLSNFLILHVNGAVVRQIQGICRKKYGVELS